MARQTADGGFKFIYETCYCLYLLDHIFLKYYEFY